MKTPFTIDQFLEIFKNYNLAVFPMQIVLYFLSLIAIFLTIRPAFKHNKIISGILAFLWIWVGVVYHIIFFTSINYAAYLFGTVFILQGILFLIYGIFRNKLSFRFHPGIFGYTGALLIIFALIVYPVIGYFLGHVYPFSPTFGLPCPTTLFTFGLLLLNDKKCPLTILIIPVIWSVIGFTAALNFGILEDIGLLVAGLLTFSMLLIKNIKQNQAR